MKKHILILISTVLILSGCKVKQEFAQVQYPTHVNWPGERAPLPVKPTEPSFKESLCKENNTVPAPVLQASANTNEVPLAAAPSTENENPIKPLLVEKIQRSKAFQKLSPERKQKVMAILDKVSAKMEPRAHRVGGMPLAIASFASSILAILSLCLTGVAPPMLIVSIFLSLAAIILGGIALRRAERRAAKALAITGIILGAITFIADLILVALVLTVLATILIL